MRDVEIITNLGSPEMRAIWTKEGMLDRVLRTEAAIARAHAHLGNIPPSVAEEISRKATLQYVNWEQVRAWNTRLHHVMMSVVRSLAEVCENGSGEYVHYAVGTSEVTDTAMALQMRDSLPIIRRKVAAVAGRCLDLAVEHRATLMPGRSLGQQILPYTLGLRFAVWVREFCRHLDRLEEVAPRVTVGMMRGAVGTKAEQRALGDHTLALEELVLGDLGLDVPEVTDQVLQRDRHAEFVWTLANIALSLDKVAWNIRTLQRTEVGELEEPFDDGQQVGSSAAPHKRNPTHSEMICGLSKIAKGLMVAMMDGVRSEHERDSSGMISDRAALDGMALTVDAMLDGMQFVLDGLEVYPERMDANLGLTNGRILSSAVLLRLARKGVGRQSSHEMVRRAGMRSFKEGRPMKEVLLEDPAVSHHLPPEELEELMDPANFLGTVEEQIDLVDRISRPRIESALGPPTADVGGAGR